MWEILVMFLGRQDLRAAWDDEVPLPHTVSGIITV